MKFKIVKNLSRIGCAIILISVLLTQQVTAITQDDIACAQTDSIECFYNPSAASPSCTTPTSGSVAGNYTPITANTYSAGDEYSFLTGKGLTPQVAAAITGNAIWESGGSLSQLTIITENPSSVGANGIHQWYEGRLTALMNLANKEGKPWTDLGVQFDYLWLELTNGPGAGGQEASALAATEAAPDIASATTTFERIFEDSGDTGSYPHRITAAENVLAKFGGGASGSPAPVGSPVGASCPSVGGSVGATGFVNPFPDGWTPGRLDMGYDGFFKTQIVSPCGGKVIYYINSQGANSWEGDYVVILCSSTIPGLPSNAFYFAEGITAVVKNGSVTAGQQIAVPGPTGFSEGPGGIEWGLADPNNPGDTLAESGVGSYTNGSAASTTMVLNFAKWVELNLHVAPPATTDHAGRA